jgi:hypothetical protein
MDMESQYSRNIDPSKYHLVVVMTTKHLATLAEGSCLALLDLCETCLDRVSTQRFWIIASVVHTSSAASASSLLTSALASLTEAFAAISARSASLSAVSALITLSLALAMEGSS